ncbi:hypothetical protein OXX80_002373 [Metschnikowia pulcherrima]
MEITLSHAAKQVNLLTKYGGYTRRRSMKKAVSRLKTPATSTVTHIPHTSQIDSDCALRSAEPDSDSEGSTSDSEELNMASDGPGIWVDELLFGIEEPVLSTSEALVLSDTSAFKSYNPVAQKRGVSPGSSVYICKRSGWPKQKKTPQDRQRVRGSQKCGCKASYTIRFCEGYKHAPDGSLNVKEHGDDVVTVTWNYDHVHKPINSGSEERTRQLRQAFRRSVAGGLSWREFVSQRTQWLLKFRKGKIPAEVFKINYAQWFYESKRKLRSEAILDMDPERSLRLWGEKIKKRKGMAAFTDAFDFKEKRPAHTYPKASQGGKIWSFCFMSKWQKFLLQQNCSIIFLDSTHKTCRGLNKKEDVYLFTLYVKNQVTGKGAPAAFMMTNCGRSEVISHFIRTVRNFAPFLPKQVVVDCDQAETNALLDVWNDEVSIVYCRWHVSKAFVNNVRTKVTVGPRNSMAKDKWDEHKAHIEEKKREIRAAFEAVVRSKSKEEGEERIADFLSNFADYPELIDYTEKQWFAKKDYIVNGRAQNFSIHACTNNLIESFHNVLKRYFLGRSSKDRPDLLVFKLFMNVETNYWAEEILVKFGCTARVNDKGEKAAREKALLVPEEEMNRLVTFVPEGQLNVKSFTNEGVSYSVKLDSDNRQKVNCTCLAFQNSSSWCKHIFLGMIWSWSASRPKNQAMNKDSDVNYHEILDSYDKFESVEDDEKMDDFIFEGTDDVILQSVGETDDRFHTVEPSKDSTSTSSESLGDANGDDLTSAASTPSPQELFPNRALALNEALEAIGGEEPALNRFDNEFLNEIVSTEVNGHEANQIDTTHIDEIEKSKMEKAKAQRNAKKLKLEQDNFISFTNAQSECVLSELWVEMQSIYRRLSDRNTNKKQRR